jgi:hypothetical protein
VHEETALPSAGGQAPPQVVRLQVMRTSWNNKQAPGFSAADNAWDAHRVDRDRDRSYSHQSAIALFDEWWQGSDGTSAVAKDVLRGTLGDLVDALPEKLDDHPRLGLGSAWNGVGWYGYVSKDLRQVLGRPVLARAGALAADGAGPARPGARRDGAGGGPAARRPRGARAHCGGPPPYLALPPVIIGSSGLDVVGSPAQTCA